jgi:polyhydroxybutyrate depolymerase
VISFSINFVRNLTEKCRISLALLALCATFACACSHSPLHSRVHTMRWEWGWRTYRLHIPPSLDRTKPAPLIVMLHGIFINAAMMEDMSGFSDLSDEKGFVVAYPNARKSRLRSFYPGLPMEGVERVLGPGVRADEIGFVNAVVDEVSETVAIDPDRIYLAGLSNGGLLSTYIASKDIGKRFRGVALVAMSSPVKHLDDLEAHAREAGGLKHRVPLVIVHGDDDPLFPIEGGTSFILADSWRVAGAFETARRWDVLLGGDGIEDSSSPMPEARRWDKTHTIMHEFHAANGAINARVYEVQGGGHSWPGPKMLLSPAEKFLGGKSTDFEASREIWRFFDGQPVP